MWFLFGIVSSAFTVWFGRKQSLFSETVFWRNTLIIIALIYLIFVAIDGRLNTLFIELAGMALFIGLAWAGYTRSLWFLVAGLLAHGLWDWAHQPDLLTGYVPLWYREACITYDFFAAGYLAYYIKEV